MKLLSLFFAAVLLVAGVNAEAARIGGGKSMGKQSGNVTQREAAPAQNAGNAAARPANAAAPAAPRRPWGAMLGGLAAGLGLAWLAHSLGMGEGFGQILMFALLAMGVFMAVRYFMRTRSGGGSPYAFQGADSMSTPHVATLSAGKCGQRCVSPALGAARHRVFKCAWCLGFHDRIISFGLANLGRARRFRH